MSYLFQHGRGPVFASVDATSSASNTSPAGQAQTEVSTGQDKLEAKYNDIFEKEMAKQADLYGKITLMNDDKNRQSSYLSLAKSVSEKV